MSKTRLHEILAVEQGAEKAATRMIGESTRTLDKKENLFIGSTKRHEVFGSDEQHNKQPTEHRELVTTVDENLEYTLNTVADYWDVVLQKEQTNQKAVADLVVDGVTLASGLPATFLLGLESKIIKIREMYNAIPTLAPGVAWEDCPSAAKLGVFQTKYDSETFQSKADIEFRVIVEPTDKHPAQVKELKKTTNIGKYVTSTQCGMLSPADKAARITRLDKVLAGVKKARQRANCAEVDQAQVGNAIFTFINKG